MPHHTLQKIVHWVSDRGVCGCCLSRTIPPSAFGCHLPLHKGGMSSGHPLIRWVTVLFAPSIASLREGGGFCEAKDGRRERNKRLSIVIFRALSFVCGRGGEASAECLYRTLLQSPTVPASSRRKPWFEQLFHSVRDRGVYGCWLIFAGRATRPVCA